MNIEKELLQKALDSILHGSTQVISEVDSYGNTVHREIRVNDLRPELVNKLAIHLAQSDGFKQALEKAFTQDVVKKMVENTIEKMTWGDLPYGVKKNIESKMKAEEVKMLKFKQTIEVIENE